MKTDLPGIELHTHLEGAVTPDRLIALAHKYGQNTIPESCLNAQGDAYVFSGFQGFLELYRKVTLLLKTPGDFHQVALDLGEMLAADQVGYAEVSLSYGVMLKRQLDPQAIQEALFEAACQVEETHGVVLRWLPDAVRQWGLDQGWRAFEAAAKAGRRWGVVGFGLGGDEATGPAATFAPLFNDVRGEGLGISIHAGEIPSRGAAAVESIRQAVEDCGAQRIGHGLAASGHPELLALLKAREVFVELCPGSNLCTGALAQISDHPLQEFLTAGVPCGLNPDDRSLFGLDMHREWAQAKESLGLKENQIQWMNRWARQSVFDPGVFAQEG